MRSHMLESLCMGIMVCSLAGCETLTPIAEVEHTSHISQHFGKQKESRQYGWNTVSVGVRIRPTDNLTIDVLDGWTPAYIDGGKHEVFHARMLYEFK